MFSSCYSVSELDLSSFNTKKVLDISFMFCLCELKYINLSSFNTKNVRKKNNMFHKFKYNNDSDNLLFGIISFNTKKVTDMGKMFYFCKKYT